MKVEEIFASFMEAINRHDVEALMALMGPDHVFVDSMGIRVAGVVQIHAGWSGYFAMCPDYWIRVDNLASEGGMVLAAGEAGGSIDGEEWHTPAAWKAVIQEGKVSEWHVFADNKPVYEILARRQWR